MGGRLDTIQPIDNRPSADCADAVKLAGTVHRVINGWVVGNGRKGRLNLVRPRNPAQMAIIEDPDSRIVFVGTGGALGFMLQQCCLHFRWEISPQFIRFLKPELNGGRRVGDDQGTQSRRLKYGMLGRQHSTPTLAQQVILVLDA
jgi:hypothetical protein